MAPPQLQLVLLALARSAGFFILFQ